MPAYLDHASTTPLSATALAAMGPWLGARVGNPSGAHSAARAAAQAVDEARDQLAALLGTTPGDVVFTAGGTEAANLAVLGRALAVPGPLVVSAVEHHCVLHAADAARRYLGTEVRVVPVGRDGVINLDALARVLSADVSLVSLQSVNNETGAVQPVPEAFRLARRRSPRAALHTDAVQAAPWFDLAAMTAAADMVSISAHKFGGPQGVGALAFRSPVTLAPISFGGPQERERRAGTHNVAGIVGMAAALQEVCDERPDAAVRVAALRDRLRAGLLGSVEGAVETVPEQLQAPGHCHLLIGGIESEALLLLLDEAGVAASAGAACASGALNPSHVVTAMGFPPGLAGGALRLSLGHASSPRDVDLALEAVPAAVAQLRRARVRAEA